jgi:HK97 family phage prohead protease
VNEWTEINSAWEGRFMERFAPGAWKKTIRENADRIKSLFQHGGDPQIGDKPLGPFRKLEENEGGGYAEVALLDTGYNRELLPGLKEGLYGASHRFSTVREEENLDPEASDENPHGLPERTIKEARLFELGPVTFPAYGGATAGMRSMTDEFLLACFRSDPDRLRSMFERATDLSRPAAERADETAPSPADAAPKGTSSRPERRDQGRSALNTTPEPGFRSALIV